MRKWTAGGLWAGLAASVVLGGAGGAAGGTRVSAFVTVPPQRTFVERIGGDRVVVEVLVGAGQNPHSYEPTPKQMARLAEAQVFFRVGWPFEERVLGKLRSVRPDLLVVDTRDGVALLPAGESHGHAEDSGHGGHGGHFGTGDPHIWLDPRRVKVQAGTIAAALAQLDPEGAALYAANRSAFEVELERVDRQLRESLAPLRGREFLVYHPAYGYFADAYGLHQVPVEVGGKEPTARQLGALIDRARREGIRVVFVQPQFSAKSAEAVARAIGGVVVPLDPLAPDYLDNLRHLADEVRRVLAGAGEGG